LISLRWSPAMCLLDYASNKGFLACFYFFWVTTIGLLNQQYLPHPILKHDLSTSLKLVDMGNSFKCEEFRRF
jgi:hypothetical protein